MRSEIREAPDRLELTCRRGTAGAFAMTFGIVCLLEARGGFVPSGLIQAAWQLVLIGAAAVALGAHWMLSRQELVLDGRVREVVLRRRLFGWAVAEERTPFAAVAAVGLLRTDDADDRWGVTLDTTGAFPLDPRGRTIVGNAAWPFVRCRIDGHTMRLLDVGDRAAMADVAARVARRLDVAVIDADAATP